VEYRLDGIIQVQVKKVAGTTFASALRSILRQAPRGSDGWATVLTVNLGSRQISKQSLFEFDGSYAYTPELIQADQNHYLCAYTGPGNNGWAVVLGVDMRILP